MARVLWISLVCFFFVPLVCAQHLWIDASQFNQGDICADIQAAIAALPNVTSTPAVSAGILIDARNFTPPAAGFLSCSVNPFALFSANLPQNPISLVAGGNGSGTAPTPGSQGGIVLLPGYTIATDVPWLIPQSWSIFGQGSRVTFIVPSSNFPTGLTSSGTVSTSGSSYTVNLTGATTWSSQLLGSVLFACPSGCTAGYQAATTVGIVTDFVNTTSLDLGTKVTISSANQYIFQTPVLAWATTSTCSPLSCTGQLQVNTAGSVIQDIGLDCSTNGAGSTVLAGCIPFWDEYGQERSQLKRIRISNFSGLGIGIYGAMAQNGGPFDDIQLTASTITSSTTCVEVGGAGPGASQPSMRGIRGLTCVGPTNVSVGTGVDINTQNFSLSDAHFEGFGVGVEIGALTSARGIFVSDVTVGTGTKSVLTAVDISSNCASTTGTNCQSFATSDINLQSIYQPGTGVALRDHISGGGSRVTNEATLGFYSLGDGSSTGTVSDRPVDTTSSTFGSSPYLIGMTLPPVTGVQGSTGTLVQMSTGSPFTSGDLLKSDSNSNTADSAIPAANIASTVTFFTNNFGTGGSVNLLNTTIKLWGFSLPNAVTTTQISYLVGSSADTINSYSFGIYDSGGNQKVAVGPSTGLVSSASTSKTVTWTTGSGTTLVPGKYYFATATNCASSCASLTSASTPSFAVNANGGTATGGGGFPAGALTLPADSWTQGNIPTFTIH